MKMPTLVTIAIFSFFLPLISLASEEIVVGEFEIELGEPWKVLSDEVKKKRGFEAVWVNPKTERPNAGILGMELPKSVSKEADGMVSSAKSQPEAIKLVEDRKVKLKDGGEARIVSLEIRASSEQLGIASPMIFHSVYLPAKDGASVTIKLQCSKGDLAALKPAFESQVLKGLIEEPEKKEKAEKES